MGGGSVNAPRTPTDFAGASFEALMDPQGWRQQMQLLIHMGHRRAGIIGVSCPRCYRGIAPDGYAPGPDQCTCEDVEPVRSEELAAIHGLGGTPYAIKRDGIVI